MALVWFQCLTWCPHYAVDDSVKCNRPTSSTYCIQRSRVNAKVTKTQAKFHQTCSFLLFLQFSTAGEFTIKATPKRSTSVQKISSVSIWGGDNLISVLYLMSSLRSWRFCSDGMQAPQQVALIPLVSGICFMLSLLQWKWCLSERVAHLNYSAKTLSPYSAYFEKNGR